MSVPKPKLYWRCAGCKEVWMEGGPGKWCESCHTNKGWEPVAVLSIAEVEHLRGIEARLDSVVLPEEHGNPAHRKYVKGCPYCEGWDDGIDVFRAAVLGGA